MYTKTSLSRICEDSLLHRFADLIRRDRSNSAELLLLIAEIDERKLWAKHACPSMFAFCVQRFHMSESATAKRIWAARTARRFPLVLQMVSDGELHLSGIAQLARHLTADNHRKVLARAKHKSMREIELLVAELAPQPDRPSRVRALPRAVRPAGEGLGNTSVTAAASRGAPGIGRATGVANEQSRTARNDAAGGRADEGRSDQGSSEERSVSEPTRRSGSHRKQVVALAPRRYKVEVTVDQQTHDTLRALQEVLGHSIPDGDPARIISRALELLLDETLKRKAARTSRPRPADARASHSPDGGRKRTRVIPAAVRREVWKRDVGRCTFVDHCGRRCRATRRMEYHHEVPFGKGGGHEPDNITLRCSAHNQYQADLDFGPGFMRERRESPAQHSARNAGQAVDQRGHR